LQPKIGITLAKAWSPHIEPTSCAEPERPSNRFGRVYAMRSLKPMVARKKRLSTINAAFSDASNAFLMPFWQSFALTLVFLFSYFGEPFVNRATHHLVE
jgi:hypothetical protein